MNTTKQDMAGRDDQSLEALFRHASARKQPPTEDERAIREAVHAEWLDTTGRRKARRRYTMLAAAASVVLAMFATVIFNRQPVPLVPSEALASVNKISGDVFVRQSDGTASVLLRADRFFTGQELSTIHGSRIALEWHSGESIRMDENSRLVFLGETGIELLAGRIYVDTQGSGGMPGELTISTPAGLVRHLGTQYMTGIRGNSVEISVREGEVLVVAESTETTAVQGQQISLTADGRQSVAQVPIYGESWSWTEQLSPGFDMDGKSMRDFLGWVARETGRQIVYASADTEDSANRTSLHGDVDLPPLRAMELVLQTSDLVAEPRNGDIFVSLRRDG